MPKVTNRYFVWTRLPFMSLRFPQGKTTGLVDMTYCPRASVFIESFNGTDCEHEFVVPDPAPAVLFPADPLNVELVPPVAVGGARDGDASVLEHDR